MSKSVPLSVRVSSPHWEGSLVLFWVLLSTEEYFYFNTSKLILLRVKKRPKIRDEGQRDCNCVVKKLLHVRQSINQSLI